MKPFGAPWLRPPRRVAIELNVVTVVGDFGLNFSSPVEKPPPPTIEPKPTALIHAPPSLNSNPIIFESKQICYPHAPVISKMRLAITTN